MGLGTVDIQVAKRSQAGHRAAAVSAAGSPTFSIWSRRIGICLLALAAAGSGITRAADEAAIQTAAQAAAPVGRDAPPGVFDTGLWPAVDDVRDNLEAEGWLLQGQLTYIQQGHPRFRSPYQGDDSMTNGKKTRETLSFGPLFGRQLWDGAALYFGPEFTQGFGLNSTTGAAGFPNGEAFRAGTTEPRLNYSRLFVRQVFGFGGAQETIERDQLQFHDTVDVHRLTITAGKLSVFDLFDDNRYSHDPRTQFMNWALMDAGAVDFAADAKGFTTGAAVDYNREDWAARAGVFQVAKTPNSKPLDDHVLAGWQFLTELEQRFSVGDRPGRIRELAMLDRTRAIRYGGFPGLAPIRADDPLPGFRRYRTSYGFALNFEQELTDELGLFSRLSWNPGDVQEFMFTEIDRSASLGLSLAGVAWGRPHDTVGLAGVVNALSDAHRRYLAAGNTGFIVGDGRLNYATEQILESYYVIRIHKGAELTFDYQLINNPAYNADRGPVSIFAVRFHVEY
ncbi:MAG: carbohydrate porin [Alphaproteobacteria bacterium]|nr:carbohydrate porin [Alphaproteobacteria bacterium]